MSDEQYARSKLSRRELIVAALALIVIVAILAFAALGIVCVFRMAS